MPTFTGTAGSDTLTGTSDTDTLISNGGSDVINGAEGDDTVVVVAQLSGYGTLNGGDGIDTLQLDRALSPTVLNGSGSPYALSLAVMNNTSITTLSSFERLAFNSLVGDQLSLILAYGGNNGAPNQIGTGLAADAVIVGGAGQDLLNFSYNSANLPGTVTAPSFTFSNWETPTRAYLGDRVTISVSGSGNTTLNGSAHVGVQGLNGGSGSDIINGSDDMDLISGGAAGADQLFGNGGDDTLFLINTYLISPSGSIGAETTRTGAGSLFHGGSGTDFLMLGGNVSFQGSIQEIEGLLLLPGYVNTNVGAAITGGSQHATTATFSQATFAALPSNLLIAGQGLVRINLANGGTTFNGSNLQFDPVTDVAFDLVAGDGNDNVTGSLSSDTLYALGGSDTLNGLGGDDTIWLYDAAASAQGGADDDRFLLMANGGGSNIDGGAGYDILSIELNSTRTSNTLTGTLAGIEEISLAGTTLVMNGTQFANGFSPTGVISGSGTLVVAMVVGTGYLAQSLTMNTGSVAFNVIGSSGSDIIKATLNAVNFINGGDSNDQIRGGALNDTINGGLGDDKLFGFTGADMITGGDGADQFRYVFAADSGVGGLADHITDFVAGTDKFNFSLLDADPVAAGRQALTFIDTQAFSATGAAQLRYGVSGANLLIQVDLDGNGTADMEIVLDNAAAQTLTSSDFFF
jgi:Ca2+-binding RTX toxin-like protein